MQSNTETVEAYISELPEAQREAISRLRETILSNIPKGFSEEMSYGMIGYVVPHSLYPKGYHCDPKLPLPFLNIAARKNFIALYHMGIYAEPDLLEWFTAEFSEAGKQKLDMGKSCIRFKKPEAIPFELIGQLSRKLSVNDWIALYESKFVSQK